MADDKIILKAEDLDGYLTAQDQDDLARLSKMYDETIKTFSPLDKAATIEQFDKMGHVMQENSRLASFDKSLFFRNRRRGKPRRGEPRHFKIAQCRHRHARVHLLHATRVRNAFPPGLHRIAFQKQKLHRRAHARENSRAEFFRPQDSEHRYGNRKSRDVRDASRRAFAEHNNVEGNRRIFFARVHYAVRAF